MTLSPGGDDGDASDSDLEPDELDYHRYMFEIMIHSFYAQYMYKISATNSSCCSTITIENVYNK